MDGELVALGADVAGIDVAGALVGAMVAEVVPEDGTLVGGAGAIVIAPEAGLDIGIGDEVWANAALVEASANAATASVSRLE